MDKVRHSQVLHSLMCLIALMFFTLTSGCIPADGKFAKKTVMPVYPAHYTARMNVFLHLEGKQEQALQLEVDRLEVLSDEGWLTLSDSPATLDSAQIGRGQFLLGGSMVPPGVYRQLRLFTTDVGNASGPQPLEFTLRTGLVLEDGDSKTILVAWDIEKSRKPDGKISPVLDAVAAQRQLPVKLLYVACPEINTVFVVRTDSGRVADSFGLPGRPTHLALDAFGERLFVLAADKKKVMVVDTSSLQVMDSYPCPFDEVTYMAADAEGQWGYFLHERSNYLSRMNLDSGQVVGRIMLESRPTFILALEEQNMLAVSLGLSHKVLLLDPESLVVLNQISTRSRPDGLVVVDNQLYIAESGESSVLKVDLSNLSDQERINVGFGPRRLVDAGNQIFVSNYLSGTLSVLIPDLPGSFQDVYGFNQPLNMFFDPSYRRVYVADERAFAVAAVDTNSNLLLGYVPLGAKPLGMAGIE